MGKIGKYYRRMIAIRGDGSSHADLVVGAGSGAFQDND